MVIIRHASFDDVAAIHAMTQAAYAEYRAELPHSSVWYETLDIVAAEMKQRSNFAVYTRWQASRKRALPHKV